jgi:cytochrome b561
VSWPLAIRLFHWLSAALIIAMLGLGAAMVRLDDAGLRFDIYQAHKAFGITVLALTVLRSVSRLVLVRRTPPVPGPAWQRFIASFTHSALYVLIFAVAFSGWIMASATPLPIPTSIFGLFDLPLIAPRNLETYKLAKAAHGWLTTALACVVLLHVAAAFKHHFWNRDSVMTRMVRGGM